MAPPPYVQPPIWHPDFIGKGTCPATSSTRRCRNKRTCDVRRRGREGEQARVVSLRDELVGRRMELDSNEKFALADSLARLSVCARCERKGTRAVVRNVVLEQLEVEFGGGKVEGLADDEAHKGDVKDKIEQSVLIQRDDQDDGNDDRRSNVDKDIEAEEAVSFPAFETLLIHHLQEDDQHDEANPQSKFDRDFEREAAKSPSPFDEIVFIQQYHPHHQDHDHDTRAQEDDPISSTPPSVRTASTRHDSSPPTDPSTLTLNSSPPDLPRLVIDPDAFADFCFETPFYGSRSSDLPSTPLSGSVQTPLTGPIHAISYLPSPTTPSKGARDVPSPELTAVAEEDGEATVRQSHSTPSSLQLHSLEWENALLREQLQDLRRDLDTAELKARAARTDAERWRKLYHNLKESVMWFFERGEQIEQENDVSDAFVDEGLDVDDDDASWSSEGEELGEAFWPLKVSKKREPPTQRVDSGFGEFVQQEELVLLSVPRRRRRRTTGMQSLGSIVEEREE